jgi:hypothetical protein
LATCLVLGLFAAVPAQATFHIMQIREVHEGGGGAADYVVLQMYAPGQNLVGGHHLRFFDGGAGAVFNDYTVPTNVAGAANQSTILIAGQGSIGVTPDFVIPNMNPFPGPSGSVCWENIDCVSIGAAAPPTGNPSPVGTPVAQATGISAGQSVVRSIAPGCATLLDGADDTNNSAADFSVTTPSPRNNASPITETPCTSTGGTPNTKIKKRPKNRSTDDSPTFKFKSDEVGSTFKCKLDRKKFHKCKSPKTYHGVAPGKHTFKVEAIDADGNVDPTPAKDKFKILP